MIQYSVNYSSIKNLIKEEVSKQAAFNAVSKEGESLYSSVMAFSRDEDMLERLVDDAIGNVVARLSDMCQFVEGTIEIHASDFDMRNEDVTLNELERYLSLMPVALWLQDRFTEKAEMYATRANAALEKAVRLIKTRKI